MNWEFNFNKEKSKIFLKYFFRKQKDDILEALSGSGNRSVNSDENYEYHLEYNFKLDNEDFKIHWIIITTLENCLLEISTVDTDDIIDNKLNRMIHDCMLQCINNDKKTYFKRSYYSIISGCNLAGEYWINGVRIAPLFGDDNSAIENSERIIVIDQEIDAIDNDEANMIAVENAENIASLLSFIMDVSIEEPIQQHKYFIDRDLSESKREISYFYDDNCPASMPKKGDICKTAKFEGSILKSHENTLHFNDVLKFPNETRKLITGVLNSDHDLKNAILNYSRLYRLSKYVGVRYSTSELAYQCAGIESISKFEKEKSFTDFMTKYVGENKELYDLIYGNLRSGHFHAGEFGFFDFSVKPNFFHNPDAQLNYNDKKAFHLVLRIGFLNWLESKIGIMK